MHAASRRAIRRSEWLLLVLPSLLWGGSLLIPVSAILLGVFLAEEMDLRHLAGVGIIGLGLVAIDGCPLLIFSVRLRSLRGAHSPVPDDDKTPVVLHVT
jgi:hypothetical protein